MGFLPLIAGPLTEIIKGVLNRVLPEKMSETDRAKLEAEMARAMMERDWSSVEAELRDRASARELAASDVARGNPLTNVLAATVRPSWGFGTLALFSYSLVGPTVGLPTVPLDDNARTIMQTVIFFYFGGRTVEKALGVWAMTRERK